MDGAAREKRESPAAQAVAQIVYSNRALQHIERAFEFLAVQDPGVARTALAAIAEAITLLEKHPMVGRRVEGDIRELVISYGASGYLALYQFFPSQDEVWVLALRHQRELDYPG